MTMQYTIVGTEDGEKNLTLFVRGQAPLVAHSSHPNYDKIEQGVLAGDESVTDLFDVAATAATFFEPLSERVTVAYGRVYFDGDEVDNALTRQISRFIEEDNSNWEPLVRFFENVSLNPNEHSREQLYTWLDKHDFTITDDGMIVGYKGVKRNNDGTLTSINTGTATVNGAVFSGAIPNAAGDVVEMPRSEVQWDPRNGCSTGLHVGTYEYASGFSQGAVLEVAVNPRDVVSVPTDSNFAKVRVCRYVVVDTLDAPYTSAVKDDGAWDEFGDYSENDDEWYDFKCCEGSCGCDDCCGQCGCCCDCPEDENDDGFGFDFFGDESEDETLDESAPESAYGVTVGDKFKDQDPRRDRTLEVVGFGEDVASNEVVVKNLATDKLSSVNADRLTTPYRFTKV
jgi:hypothetical protein